MGIFQVRGQDVLMSRYDEMERDRFDEERYERKKERDLKRAKSISGEVYREMELCIGYGDTWEDVVEDLDKIIQSTFHKYSEISVDILGPALDEIVEEIRQDYEI